MATEDRWHDFSKEKPSEDMEGRDFIVSNGYSDTLSMWCGGYWENEPFMGNKLCDEVVRWKGYLTPEEEKANEATCKELFVEEGYNGAKYYDKDAVDALLAKKDKEIAELKKKCEAEKSIGATFSENGAELARWVEELRTEIESLKASHYAEMVDAGMRERRLRRALWIAKAESAIAEAEYWYGHCAGMYYIDATDVPDEEDNPYKRVKDTTMGWYKTWMNIERKCRAKAEEYK